MFGPSSSSGSPRDAGPVMLARSLMALRRAKATGTLTVGRAGATARLIVVEGTPRAARRFPDDGCSLGDLLLRTGSLAPYVHRVALGAGPVGKPVGHWLVGWGIAKRRAVDRALTEQLRLRIAEILTWERPTLRFEPGAPEPGLGPFRQPPEEADLVLEALVRWAEQAYGTPPAGQRNTCPGLGGGPVALTPAGESFLAHVALCPRDRVVVSLARAGVPVAVLLDVVGARRRVWSLLRGLTLAGALEPKGRNRKGYEVLLRKQRQLRKSERPEALLELAGDPIPGEAGRALRRLAKRVHPDRFGPSERTAIRRVSEEVMAGLAQAEESLRQPE